MDEKKLDSKCYKPSSWPRIFFFVLFLLLVICAPFMFRDKMYHLFWGSIIFSLGSLHIIIILSSQRILIEQNMIIKSLKYPSRIYEIKFNEISQIIDDDISTWPFEGHVFHLIPKQGVKKNFKRFTVHGGIKNRRKLMSEIILMVDKDTYIEPSVLNYIHSGPKKGRIEL